MPLRAILIALLALLLPVGCASIAPLPSGGFAALATTADTTLDPVSSPQWASDMARFTEQDAARRPPAHPIVFTGSSSVRMWASLADDFPDKPVLNRGFGGSQVRDAAHYEREIAGRYAPRQVMIYSGDNDIDAGRSPGQVLADFRVFVARVRRDVPDVPIAYLSIKPSLARLDQLPRQQAANALIQAAAAGMDDVAFIDVATPMLDTNGRPRAELFLDDGLHMTPAGYAIWAKIVAPWLR